MELLKPIIVKRWISETNYKIYVFDTNKDNKYNSSYTIISEYIFQDNSCNEALSKIAYYIMEKEKDLQYPYYFMILKILNGQAIMLILLNQKIEVLKP